jgi:hypothetical protein
MWARRTDSRSALAALLVAGTLAVSAPACSKPGSPEQVADAFAEAYFRRMDQEKAKEFTALGASAMLDEELRSVAEIRKEGYSPGEGGAEVTIRRGESTPRDQRVRIPYEIVIKSEGAESTKDADIELTKIDGTWKVVRVGLKAR